MSKKQVLVAAETVSNEKDVDKEMILQAVEAALAKAIEKRYGVNYEIRVSLNRRSGDFEAFRRWTIVPDEELEFPERQLTLEEAQTRKSGSKLGEVIEELFPTMDLGRIAAQTAKQVIVQKVRDAERAKVVTSFTNKVGQLVTGVIKKVIRDGLLLDLGNNIEAFIPREEMIPKEELRLDDRVRGYLYAVKPQARGPQLFISRTHPQFLVELFKIEVPEIGEDLIEIKSAARDPGSRAKIAVKTNDGRIDPIGACVGMRGARVQAVSSELCGERIDIVLWDDSPVQLVINAMAPAEVASIVLDEDTHTMDVAVLEEQLSQAIGRNGQNVRLASQLTSWTINVMTMADMEKKAANETETNQKLFIEKLGVDEDVAQILVREGFTTLEEIAYVPLNELEAIDEFDAEIAELLQNRAKDLLLTQALASEEKFGAVEPANDLLELKGMERHLAFVLASHGIVTREDLAEQAVDDLLDVAEISREKAAELIMAAREPWFSEK